MKTSTASLILIGNELLNGSVQDVHVRYLSGALTACGIPVSLAAIIPDDDTITKHILRAARDSDFVIIAGGLGPTSDDLTRESVAEAAGVALNYIPEVTADLERRFSGNMAMSNKKQAYIPDGFSMLENPAGTAPGFCGRLGDAFVVALPGPPHELKTMVDLHLNSILYSRFTIQAPSTLKLSTFLISESRIEDLLRESAVGDVQWGTRAEPYRILIELRGGTEQEMQETAGRLADALGPICCEIGDCLPHQLLLKDLIDKRLCFVGSESCTGGLIGKMLTDLPGSSEAIWGSLVTYSNRAKQRVLSVPESILDSHGAVSEETVLAMCNGALSLSEAGVAVAVSGVAGPGGGTDAKPVGTVWVASVVAAGAIDANMRTFSRVFHFNGSRDLIRRRSAVAAILCARSLINAIDVDKNKAWAYI